MARKIAEHGTRQRYLQGCTDGPDGESCDPCRQANAEYKRQNDQANRAKTLGVVTPITKAKRATKPEDAKPAADKPREPGPMELACLAVLANLQRANLQRAKARPDLAMAAVALARDIDLPLAIAQRKNLVSQYQVVMDDLLKGSEKKRKLAAVRQMANPTTATG